MNVFSNEPTRQSEEVFILWNSVAAVAAHAAALPGAAASADKIPDTEADEGSQEINVQEGVQSQEVPY